MTPAAELSKRYPPSKLQNIARELYSQGKYEDAIEAFTATIQSSKDKPKASLLASRAACYEKLGKTSLALKDGKRMIELEPSSVQGYLVAGHLLKESQNDALALKIYERGLRFCKTLTDRLKLEARLSKLPGGSQGHHGADPVHLLPVEILEMIFAYIPFNMLCVALKVSRTWRSQLKGMPTLWLDVDLSTAKKPVRGQDVVLVFLLLKVSSYADFNRSMVEHSQKRLRTIVLKNTTVQNSKLLQSITQRNQALHSLTLLSGGELSDSLSRAISWASGISRLKLSGNVFISVDTAQKVVELCPNIVDLDLGAVQFPSSLETWDKHQRGPRRDRLRSFALTCHTPGSTWTTLVSFFSYYIYTPCHL